MTKYGYESMNLKKRLRFAAWITLLTGLSLSATIYFFAGNLPEEAEYIADFESSKKYIRELEMYGGKMNVLFSDFMRWFDGLWHGKKLAFSVAWLSLAASGVLALLANALKGSPIDDATQVKQ